jgi:hypothetical protein
VADDKQDVGAFTFFPYEAKLDWGVEPQSMFGMHRRVIRYPGTIHSIESINPWVPMEFKGVVHLHSQKEIGEFQDWFETTLGRVNKFWIKYYQNSFTLYEDVALASSFYRIVPNQYYINFQGHERVFMDLINGDVITRHVTAVVEESSEPPLYYQLTIATTSDRVIATTDVVKFGRLMLVRLDQDRVDIEFENRQMATAELSFREMIHEYDEI